jgi:hypothetical protein
MVFMMSWRQLPSTGRSGLATWPDLSVDSMSNITEKMEDSEICLCS